MKKTLVALAVTAFAASASATTIYDAEGTKVDFEGSLRLVLERTSLKTIDANGKPVYTALNRDGSEKVVTRRAHTGIHNAGSRFAVKVKHDIAQDFYALGRVEFRFNGTAKSDGFGDLYAHRAYVGLGSKQFGELTFGRQVVIADDLSQSTDYNYGINPKGGYIVTDGKQVIRYDYRGVENLHLSANYNFAEDRDKYDEVVNDKLQNAYGVGALYTVGDFDLRAAYGHTNYKTENRNTDRSVDGVLGSFGYTLGNLKLSFDTGYAREKDYTGAKTNKFYVSPNFAYQVTPASKVYGNYLYERAKTKELVAGVDVGGKEKTHGFLLGADYQFHKHVVAFVEGKYVRTKGFDKTATGYAYAGKSTDKAIGVGMRVFW